MSGRGTNFWIPLYINPDQRDTWFDLLDEESDTTAGGLQLKKTRIGWTLYVSVEIPVEDTSELPENPTPIGVDVGESMLAVGCALQHDTPTDPLLISGKETRRLRKEMFTVLTRLQERGAAQWRIDERFEYYQNRLTDIIEKAARDVIEYAKQFPNPVIVLESLSFIRENLDYGKYMNRRLHSWAFARLQGRIDDKAAEAGIPVRYVNPAYTSQTCHACNYVGSRPRQAEFCCSNGECWVSEYQSDINAAAKIAQRLDPWGESLSWKPVGDDSPRDGSPCDRATRPVHDRDTNGVASQTPARDGVDDNEEPSKPLATAGATRLTVYGDSLETSRDGQS